MDLNLFCCFSLLVKPEQSDPSVLVVENSGAACDLQSARWSQPSLASLPDFVFAVGRASTQTLPRLFNPRCVSSPRGGTPAIVAVEVKKKTPTSANLTGLVTEGGDFSPYGTLKSTICDMHDQRFAPQRR